MNWRDVMGLLLLGISAGAEARADYFLVDGQHGLNLETQIATPADAGKINGAWQVPNKPNKTEKENGKRWLNKDVVFLPQDNQNDLAYQPGQVVSVHTPKDAPMILDIELDDGRHVQVEGMPSRVERITPLDALAKLESAYRGKKFLFIQRFWLPADDHSGVPGPFLQTVTVEKIDLCSSVDRPARMILKTEGGETGAIEVAADHFNSLDLPVLGADGFLMPISSPEVELIHNWQKQIMNKELALGMPQGIALMSWGWPMHIERHNETQATWHYIANQNLSIIDGQVGYFTNSVKRD